MTKIFPGYVGVFFPWRSILLYAHRFSSLRME